MKAKLELSITANVNIVLTEMEARALKGIVSYGTDAFLEVFYSHLVRGWPQELF